MTLLDDAAVRFDFSQYTDINDMVDVNGGWGPIVPDFDADTVEFNATGLHFVTDGTPRVQSDFTLDGTGPLILGPDGLTIIQVVRNDAAFSVGLNKIGICEWVLLAAGGAPHITVVWNAAVGEDVYQCTVVDIEPSYETVVAEDQTTNPSGLASATITAGVFVQVTVLDVVGQESRMTMVSPDGRFDNTEPFVKLVPGFAADPRVINSMVAGGSPFQPNDHTAIEWLGWNRALTLAEVDDLVAFFIDGTPLLEDPPAEGGEGRNYRQRRRTWPVT